MKNVWPEHFFVFFPSMFFPMWDKIQIDRDVPTLLGLVDKKCRRE